MRIGRLLLSILTLGRYPRRPKPLLITTSRGGDADLRQELYRAFPNIERDYSSTGMTWEPETSWQDASDLLEELKHHAFWTVQWQQRADTGEMECVCFFRDKASGDEFMSTAETGPAAVSRAALAYKTGRERGLLEFLGSEL